MEGVWMQSLRKGVGLLGKEVAKELGVSAETVSRWERGSTVISKMVEDSFLRLVRDPERVAAVRANRRRRHMTSRESRIRGAME
jgi:DNA-binding transcriptional regulator YiaG